eukprot:7313724-Ditylum_brightwellii.AAC.1
MLSAVVLHALQTPALLVPIPGFWARTVAPAVDDGTLLTWWQWQQDDSVLLVPTEAMFGLLSGIWERRG